MAQIVFKNGVAPSTPGLGSVSLYSKSSDKSLYYLDDTGLEVGPLGTGGGSGGLTQAQVLTRVAFRF